MEHKEQKKLRRLLKKNGFVKSDTSENKELMEFILGNHFCDDCVIVYTYDEVEVTFGDGLIIYVPRTIEEFADIFENNTGLKFKIN